MNGSSEGMTFGIRSSDLSATRSCLAITCPSCSAISRQKRKRSAWPHATDLSGHAWMDQHHRRHSRSLEQIKQRAGAVEEACSPLSDARAGHDQMDIAVERVTPPRRLQA